MGTNLGSGFDNRNDTNSLTSSLIGEFLVNDNLIIYIMLSNDSQEKPQLSGFPFEPITVSSLLNHTHHSTSSPLPRILPGRLVCLLHLLFCWHKYRPGSWRLSYTVVYRAFPGGL